MIPKIIHYCWFGRNPKPKLAKKCIQSWKCYCCGYQIIEWNEDNYDLSKAPLYVRQAYEAKEWAFVTDYVRLQVVYENGGIYMDTDVELLKSLDPLLFYDAYFGFEDEKNIATGLGFGAVQGCSILQEMMNDYCDIPFVLADGRYDVIACPARNTPVFVRHGLVQNNSAQLLAGNVKIFPTEVLCPIDYETKIKIVTDNTISIHWYSASWRSRSVRNERKLYFKEKFYIVTGVICSLGRRVLGESLYTYIRDFIKKLVR